MKFEEASLFGGSARTSGSESDPIDLLHYLGYSVQFVYDDTTPTAGAFTAAVTDICTKNGHGFSTGLKVRVSSDDTLPTGLLSNTDYFVIVGTANTFALTDSLEHALAGTDIINIGDAGTGTHTITPTSLAGGNVKLQWSNNGTNWSDVTNGGANITGDGNAMYNFSGVYYRYVKAVFAITAGQVVLSGKLYTKGE
jgi:hypothetical protein